MTRDIEIAAGRICIQDFPDRCPKCKGQAPMGTTARSFAEHVAECGKRDYRRKRAEA